MCLGLQGGPTGAAEGAAEDEVVDEVVGRLARLSVAGGARDKVKSLAEVAAIAARHRELGQAVVQAHGTFDLIHLGHVRHLELARRLGDLLVVTLTADRFVNKGPGRPVFDQAARAEMLAALEYVDLVAVTEARDAVRAIEAIRPAVYVKGQDYANPSDDVTGKIVAEQQAVERYGGRIHFTDDVVFSSTELVNRHFDVLDPHVREHLDQLRAGGALAEILDLIERIRDFRVVLVGDAVIDDCCHATPLGNPTGDGSVAARFRKQETFVGGVLSVASHLSELCRQVDVVTCLGSDGRDAELIRRALAPNVELRAVRRNGSAATVRQRFVDPTDGRLLFEMFNVDDAPLPSDVRAEVDAVIGDRAPRGDLVVVVDLGHGLIAGSTLATLATTARFLAVDVRTNSASWGCNLLTRYPRADYACVDAIGARLALGERRTDGGDAARRLLHELGACPRLIVTDDRHGCVTCERAGPIHTVPALVRRETDAMGGNDAFLAVTAPLAAAGGALDRIGFAGNVAAALVPEVAGHRRAIDRPSLVKSVTGLLK